MITHSESYFIEDYSVGHYDEEQCQHRLAQLVLLHIGLENLATHPLENCTYAGVRMYRFTRHEPWAGGHRVIFEVYEK